MNIYSTASLRECPPVSRLEVLDVGVKGENSHLCLGFSYFSSSSASSSRISVLRFGCNCTLLCFLHLKGEQRGQMLQSVCHTCPCLHNCRHCFRTNLYREKNVLSFLELVLFMVWDIRVTTSIPQLA